MKNELKRGIRRSILHFRNRLYEEKLSLPEAKFVKDMVIGLLRSGEVTIAAISRALDENTKYEYIEKRIRRNLSRNGFDRKLREVFLSLNSRNFKKYKWLITDITDIQKEYAIKMENLATVRDGDTGDYGNGYWMINIFGATANGEDFANIYTELYSLEDGEMVSENKKILEAADTVYRHLNKDSHILMIDRGGDRDNLIIPFIKEGKHFVLRLARKRHLKLDGDSCGWEEWERRVELTREMEAQKIKRNGQKKIVKFRVGIKKVYLDKKGVSEQPLWLLVSKRVGANIGEGEGYSYYLGFLPSEVEREDEALDLMFKGYGLRWKIEEYHRHIKGSFSMEKVQVGKYQRLKTMMQLVVIAAFFLYDRLKERILRFHFKKLKPNAIKKIMTGRLRFIYYKITQELRLLLQEMIFYRKVVFKQQKKKLKTLFPSLEMEEVF